MIGATATGDGAAGLVPPPPKGTKNRYLGADGTWSPPDGGNAEKVGGKTAGELLDYRNMTNTPTIPTSLPANGGDADTLDGSHASQADTPGTAVVRGSDGSVQVGRIISDTPDDENTAVGQVIVTNGSDDYFRKASLARLKGSVGNGLIRYGLRFDDRTAHSSNNTVRYLKFMRLKTAHYWPYPTIFKVANRSNGYSKVVIFFADSGSTDPALKSIQCSRFGTTKGNVYIAKSGTSMWDLYIDTGNYDVVSYVGERLHDIGIEGLDEVVSSLPTGYIAATEVSGIL